MKKLLIAIMAIFTIACAPKYHEQLLYFGPEEFGTYVNGDETRRIVIIDAGYSYEELDNGSWVIVHEGDSYSEMREYFEYVDLTYGTFYITQLINGVYLTSPYNKVNTIQ